MGPGRFLSILTLVAGLVPVAARADEPASRPSSAAIAAARVHFARGSSLYAAGRYSEAIAEFEAAEGLAFDPAFDFDIAACYRKLGDLADARRYLLLTLHEAPAGSPYRGRAAQQLGEIEATLTAASAPASRPRASAQPSSVPAPASVPAVSTAVRAVPAASSAPSWTRAYMAAGVTAALLAGGAGFGLAGLSADDALHSRLGDPGRATSEMQSAQRDYLVANILFAGSAVAAGVTAWLFYRVRTERAPRVSLAVMPGGGGIGLGGTW